MARLKGSEAANKVHFTKKMDEFLKKNFENMTNQELANKLGLKLTVTRNRLYALGLKRMKLQYWTAEQVQFLKDNYKTIGDTELAEIFAKKWEKEKGWTKKHIEKKRRYLKLKRSKTHLKDIFIRNVQLGRYGLCAVNAWKTRGVTPEGGIKVWGRHKQVYKKIDSKYIKLSHHVWEQHHGAVPAGTLIVHKDGNGLNCELDNLQCITRGDNMARNSGSVSLTDNYLAGIMTHGDTELRKLLKENPEILDLKRTQLKLQKTIKEKQHGKH
jgi:hypothetical protein